MLSVAFDVLITVAVGGFVLGMAVKIGRASFKMGKKVFKDHDDD